MGRGEEAEDFGGDFLGVEEEGAGEGGSIDCGREDYEHGADEGEVEEIDEHHGKKHTAVFEVGLAADDHCHGENEVECPSRADPALE